MMARIRVLLSALLLGLAALPTAARAQATAPQAPPTQAPPTQTPPFEAPPVMPPPQPLQAPPGVRIFPTPPQVVGRELTLEEAIQIGLDNAPKITAAAGDYAAARQRVTEALSPLLPQLSGQWNGFENQTVTTTSAVIRGGQSVPERTITSRSLSTTATVTASQLLFDFGKNWAATDAAKASAESFRQAVELQRQTIAVNVKTSYFTLLLSKRLVGVNTAALDRALARYA